MWYHDHQDPTTAEHVYRGLAGFYLTSDAFEEGLKNTNQLPKDDPSCQPPSPVPAGVSRTSRCFDIPLVVQDKRLNADGSLQLPDPLDHDGFLGDVFLVNGVVQPHFEVARRKYRFRFLNGSNARFYEFFLSADKTPILAPVSTVHCPRIDGRFEFRTFLPDSY